MAYAEQLFWRYMQEKIDLKKKNSIRRVTLAKYDLHLRYIKTHWAEVRVKDVTPDRYQRLINLYAEKHSRETTRDFARSVNWVIRLAHKQDGLFKVDPSYDITIPNCKEVKSTRKKFLEVDEIKKLSNVLKKDNGSCANFCLLTLHTGFRFSETLAITPNDIDWENKTISITKSFDYKEMGTFDKTKNKSSIRTIKVDDIVLWILARHIKQYDVKPDEPIFAYIRGFWHNSTINTALKNLCEIAGVPRITIHSLRHQHASYLVMKGISANSVAKRLGHSDIDTTIRVYVHQFEKQKEMEEKKIIELMGGL